MGGSRPGGSTKGWQHQAATLLLTTAPADSKQTHDFETMKL